MYVRLNPLRLLVIVNVPPEIASAMKIDPLDTVADIVSMRGRPRLSISSSMIATSGCTRNAAGPLGGDRHGTLRDVRGALDRVARMGFDVLYLPPIHPIGTIKRKGPDNTLDPGPDAPGSPWAIGSAQGGHTAVHPQLGTLDDFRHFQQQAHAHGLELAMDFAIPEERR